MEENNEELFKVDINVGLVDLILNLIKQQKLSSYKTIYPALPINKKLQEFEFDPIAKKLMEDGYVYLFDNRFYTLTVNGHLFWQNGGYREYYKIIKISERHEYIQTLVLTYGTGVAGLYGLFEILKWLFHHEGWKLFF